jgi:hypothetical protein
MHWLEIGVLDMNKRIKKKHQWLGVKRAGANYCANEISRHIGRKILYSGITPKPSYILNVRRHVRWFFHHSSEEEWTKRVAEAYYPKQMALSAKHLLPVDHTAFNGRYRPNPPVKDILDDMAERRKIRKEELLSGVNVHIDDMHSLAYRIRVYEEYGATGERLSQDKEENNNE